MRREKDLCSFVWTPQSVSPSFPILLVDVYVHILEKIPNRGEQSFTSRTLCLSAIIFSYLYNASLLSFDSFLSNFSFMNTIRETKQKIPQPKWTKNVIQSLCQWCYWQFQLRNHLYRHELIWHREQLVLFQKTVFSVFWVWELHRPAEANRVNMWSATPKQLFQIYFFCSTASIWVGLQKLLKQSNAYHASFWPQKQAISSHTNYKKHLQ